MRRILASGLFALSLFMLPHAAHAVMEDYPSVKLQGLDKSVGRTVTFEAKVGSTIQYGPLFIKIHACRKAPPIEKPESAAFLQIWEVPPGAEKSEWAFSGWMFASSPALSAMDHPVYDVWVLDCTGREEPLEEPDEETPEDAGADDPAAAPATEDAPIPTDSEAEEPFTDDAAVPPATAPADGVAPQAQEDPLVATDPAMAAPAVPPVEEERGVTAYDFMKQPGANAAPAPAPSPVLPPQY